MVSFQCFAGLILVFQWFHFNVLGFGTCHFLALVRRKELVRSADALVNVNSIWGGGSGVWSRAGDLTEKSISSEGGLIEYHCLGVGTLILICLYCYVM